MKSYLPALALSLALFGTSVTAKSITEINQQTFNSYNWDEDGFLSEDEFGMYALDNGYGGAMGDNSFDARDTNGDGQMSFAEFDAPVSNA